MTRWVVVLAGGVGSRFWPLSTPGTPKQLLPLVDERPLLVNTLDRLVDIADAAHTLILTNARLVAPIRALLPQFPPENIIAEPRPAGTAAALAWGAHEIARRGGPDDIMISVHADWAVGDPAGFRDTLLRAAAVAASARALVTVGIVPTRPDPGFGYIRPGTSTADGAFAVAEFAEKPDRERAVLMLAEGFLWNSGIFVWRAGDFLDEIRAHTPEVAPALAAAEAGSDIARFFRAVTPVSVDVGVLERTTRLLVIPGDFGWDDVGTWAALHRVRVRDGAGNATHGRVFAIDSRNNVVHADGSTVVLYGVEDLVVVTREGLTLVTSREGATDLKALLAKLPAAVRDLA